MNENYLENMGLSSKEARVYHFLLSVPSSTVRVISKEAKISRELTYVVLEKLLTYNLVEKIDNISKILHFRALHPKNLKSLVDEKTRIAEEASESFGVSILDLVNIYNSTRRRPGVEFYEGVEGISKVYDMIREEAQKVYVFRSYLDKERTDIQDLLSSKLVLQAKAGVKSYVLTPHLSHMSALPVKHNAERGISRKIISKEKFLTPAMIMIWNKKVAICSLTDDMTTIIENESIATTFKTLFQYIWDSE